MVTEDWYAYMEKEEGLYTGKGKATLIYENGKTKYMSFCLWGAQKTGVQSKDLKVPPYKRTGSATLWSSYGNF